MANEIQPTCSHCNKTEGLKKCGRCKRDWYCSGPCQKADWPEHKRMCTFTIPTSIAQHSPSDGLEMLRNMPSPRTGTSSPPAESSAALQVFNMAEIRVAIFDILLAKALLVAQRVCRAWYLHIALEPALAQRLFFAPGPGRLVFAASNGKQAYPAVQPRNKNQLEAAKMNKGPMWGDGGLYHVINGPSGDKKLASPTALEKDKKQITLNPLFTLIWPQDPTNMTLSPYTAYGKKSYFHNKQASWRRMQVTSPPVVRLDLSVWITKPDRKGTQLRFTTGNTTSGVTMGDLASLLETTPRRFERHWMQIDGQAWWLRSADAVVLPESEEPEVDTPALQGVYVNPSNGIPFPGGF